MATPAWQKAEHDYENRIYDEVPEPKQKKKKDPKKADAYIPRKRRSATPLAAKVAPPVKAKVDPTVVPDWLSQHALETRAELVARGDKTAQLNPTSTKLWQSGNSLSDNMRILASKK